MKPFWMPDTQGFLAIAIVTIVGAVLIMLLLHPIVLDDKTTSLLQVMLGILLGSFKDVYSFFFGSSKGSEKKDDALISGSISPSVATVVVPPGGTVAKSLAFIAVLMTAMFLFGGSAFAQQPLKLKSPVVTDGAGDKKCLIPWDPLKLCGELTGKPEEDMQRVVKRIQGLGRDDMNYAILKATAANTNGSKVRLQCLQAILAAKDSAEGVGIKDAQGNVVPKPDPAVVTAIEDIAELVDALSPQGPLMTGCAGAAQLFKTNTLAAINGIVTGAAGLAALPAGL